MTAPTLFFVPSPRSPVMNPTTLTTPSVTVTSPTRASKPQMLKRPQTVDSTSRSPMLRPTLSPRSPSYDDASLPYSRAPLSPSVPSSPSLVSSAPNTPKLPKFFLPLPEPLTMAPPKVVSPTQTQTQEKGFLANMRGRLRAKSGQHHVRSGKSKSIDGENSMERKTKTDKKEKKERQERIKRAYMMGEELWRESKLRLFVAIYHGSILLFNSESTTWFADLQPNTPGNLKPLVASPVPMYTQLMPSPRYLTLRAT
ncbi:hypothetical protein K435DRAFT_797788 [Dendrothele bispora CBS 962.96]|uniref:Uncharacterized protein n=1 Tax=Dendrothele bispora (strain CBS 962.96) TaxID=1314807 RepID=A0A4V4HFQ9_DENBC|nr:hypothetical protein K435DRAFT_797788 [Dendrothele bispora CBS 962.96]